MRIASTATPPRAAMSSIGARLRSGLRITAYGRHHMAKPAPIKMPPARVIVLRYSVSVRVR
jgi:hypothetical protein